MLPQPSARGGALKQTGFSIVHEGGGRLNGQVRIPLMAGAFMRTFTVLGLDIAFLTNTLIFYFTSIMALISIGN